MISYGSVPASSLSPDKRYCWRWLTTIVMIMAQHMQRSEQQKSLRIAISKASTTQQPNTPWSKDFQSSIDNVEIKTVSL